MTARFRSAFFGSSGFVAARPAARIVDARAAVAQSAVDRVGAPVTQQVAVDPVKSSDVLAA